MPGKSAEVALDEKKGVIHDEISFTSVPQYQLRVEFWTAVDSNFEISAIYWNTKFYYSGMSNESFGTRYFKIWTFRASKFDPQFVLRCLGVDTDLRISNCGTPTGLRKRDKFYFRQFKTPIP